MATVRFSNQHVTLADGTRLPDKNVEVCSQRKYAELGGTVCARTVGFTKHEGKIIPLRRVRGFGGPWKA